MANVQLHGLLKISDWINVHSRQLYLENETSPVVINCSVNCLKIACYSGINKAHIKKDEVNHEVGGVLHRRLSPTVTGSHHERLKTNVSPAVRMSSWEAEVLGRDLLGCKSHLLRSLDLLVHTPGSRLTQSCRESQGSVVVGLSPGREGAKSWPSTCPSETPWSQE